MSKTWVTSDTHFCHKRVAELRGFASSDDHDRQVIRRWNAVVSRDDTVWHLGDVGLGKTSTILGRVSLLNGTKHLVTGNHDAPWPGHRDSHKHQKEWLCYFASVQAFAKRRLNDRTVLMSHFPYADGGDHTAEERYRQFRLGNDGQSWLLHGHTHSADIRTPGFRQLHVGLDAWDLFPVGLDVLYSIINARED